MNKWIKRLGAMAAQRERTILGAISGTSMDGVDLALCRIEGAGFETKVQLLESTTLEPEEVLKREFYELAYSHTAPAAEILRFEARLSRFWCEGIAGVIEAWGVYPDQIDLLASHGQTILHLPDRKGGLHNSWQLVDGDRLAFQLGIVTVSDFRRKQIAAGYEGAPLAPFGELLLFSSTQEERLLLNLGGIANLTHLPAGEDRPRIPFATDTGPANTLLDEAVRRLLPGKRYDESGDLARKGRIHEGFLSRLLAHPFFSRPAPKSTGQEDFNWTWVHRCMLETAPAIRLEDLLATLIELTVRSVSDQIPGEVRMKAPVIYVSGGGWHNRFLIERLERELFDCSILSSESLGLDPDAKEAILFAVMANELVAGGGWLTDRGANISLGKISLP